MTLGGLGLSFSRKLSPIETNVELWNGDHMFSYKQPPGYNAWMKIYIAKDDDNDGAMGYSINGQLTLMLSVQDLNKALTHVYVTRWDVFLQLEAGLNFDFRLKIFGQQVGVYFEQLRAKAVGYLSLGGFGRQWCGASADPPGVFVNLVFARQPFGHSLFAKLFQPRTDIIVSAFLNYDVSDALRSTPSGDAVITPLLNALKPDIRQLADLITNFTTSTLTLIDEAISERLSDLETRVNELHDKIDNAILGLSTGTLKDIPDVVTPITTSMNDIQTDWGDLKAQIISQTRNLESDLTLYIDRYINRAKQSIDDLVKNFIDHILRLKNGLSGVGLRFASELNIFGLKFGLVEVELVASSKLGQCSRFSDVYQHLGDETAVRGLVVLPVYYRYPGITIEQVGHEFALSLERHDFIFRFLARIKILGLISSEPNLFINPKFIFFEAEGKIWGVSYASVNARASVSVPWRQQWWTVSGEFDLRSFPAAMNREMTRASEYLGQMANKRLNMAKDIFEIYNAKLDDAKSWLDKKKADVEKAEVLFDSAVNALSRVENSLESMQEQVEQARDWLREKQRDVDKLCRIKTCKKLCIPGIKCRLCSKKVLGVKVRYPCCGFTKCMVKVPNLVCIAANVICAGLRAVAFTALKLAEEAIGITMVTFDQAQLLVQGAQVVVDKSRVVLEAAEVGFDLAKGSFTAMQEASRGAQLAMETTTRLVAGGLEVFNFIVRHGRGAVVDVKRSWFELEVSTFDVFLFEVYMEVDFFRLGSRELSVMINFKNYPESISNAAAAIIKNIAYSLIPIRGRRAIEGGPDDTSNSYNESNSNNDTIHIKVPFNDVFEDGNRSSVVSEDKEMEFRIRMFDEKCSRFEELADYLIEAMTVLYDIAFDSNAGMGNATDALNGIDDMIYNITHIEKNNTGINMTEAFFNYNLTEQDIALAVMDLNVTENLVVNESINALFTVKDITLDEITAASDYHIITPWKQVMMNYTTEVFADDECASFEDCLFYTFDEIYGLYENVDLPNTTAMRSLITDAKQQFFAVLRNDSLRIADAEAVAAGVLDLLQESRDMKIFCATPPSITLQPSNLTTVENNNITLFCKAAADPPASYTWYKDGHLISAPAVTGDLYLSSVSESSRGWYLCQAGNHVANMTSVEVYVDVHTAPVITNVSESKLVLEGEEPPVVLTCNSTGWPLPSTQWFFTSTMSTNTSLDVDDGSLVLVKPHVSQTGSYTCEASNIVGKDTSKEIKVTIVGTSAAVPELTVSFEFYDGVLYEDHKMNITRCYTITRGSTEFVNNLKETISSELQNILGIGVDRFLDWRVTNIAQGDGIHGEVGVSIIAANITNTSTADNSYERIESFYRSGKEDLSLLGTILQEASFQERVLFGEDGCSASFKSGTMNLTAPSGRCPAGYRVHETKNFLCVCCGPGQYRPAAVSSSTCLPCPFGSYQPSMCSSSCIPFPCGLTSIPTGSGDVDKDISPILKPSVINTAESQEPTYAGQVILATMEDHLWLLNMCQMFNMDVETVHRPELPPVIAAHKMTDFLLIRLILVQQQKEFTIV
ncbi:uncharacterized protein [Ptychodera flava]|uniref:uncharacterized protein isoform X1 n=1 Tax=Ptychodera flava TaxID=63121 RepID=UPI00396A9E72